MYLVTIQNIQYLILDMTEVYSKHGVSQHALYSLFYVTQSGILMDIYDSLQLYRIKDLIVI